MTIWLDAHLSPSMAKWITNTLGISATAVRDLGLRDAKDFVIFQAARKANMDVAAEGVLGGGMFVSGLHWNYTTGPELVRALLAVIVVWKADWIAEKVGKFGSSSKAADTTSEPAPGVAPHRIKTDVVRE